MILKVWRSFAKKRNSTKRPSEGIDVEAVLKEPCSLENPVLQLNASYWDVTYLLMKGSYYFVEDCTYITNDIVELSCKLDSLATYKSAITSSTQYVERSSHECNTDIPDELNSPTLETIKTTTAIALPGVRFLQSGGCYVLTVAGNTSVNPTSFGSGTTNSYALTESEMVRFVNEFFTEDVIEQLKQEFQNPLSCIVSCLYLPIDIQTITGVENVLIYCGTYQMETSGKLVTNRLLYASAVLQMQTMMANQIDVLGEEFAQQTYLWSKPYTMASLYLPFVGAVDFPIELVYKSALYLTCVVDVITGDMIYSFGANAKNLLAESQDTYATYAGNCASQCPVAQQTTHWKNVGMAILQFVGMASGNAILMGASSTVKNVEQMQASVNANFVGNTLSRAVVGVFGAFGTGTQSNGAISSSLSQFISTAVKVTTITRVPSLASIAEANALYGRPLNRVVNLSTFSGYTKCNGACIELACDYNTRKEIEYYLDTGFYIE